MISFAKRIQLSISAFFCILGSGVLPDDVRAAMVDTPAPHPPALPAAPAASAPAAAAAPAAAPARPAAPAAPAPDAGHRAAQVLAILQRDARLVDFLMEDLTPYADAQVGAAVRDVHRGAREALDRYFTLEPVIDDEEGRPVTVTAPDASRVKVVGHAGGSGSVRGVLRHRGWELTRIDLPPLPASGQTVVAPAEIEVA